MSSDGPRRWLRPVLGAIAGSLLFLVGYISAAPGLAYRSEPRFAVLYDVVVDGQRIGRISDPEMAPKVLAKILETASSEQGMPVTAKESVEVSQVNAVADSQILNESQLQARLKDALTLNMYAVALRVNGNDAVYLPDRQMAEALLEKLEEHFRQELVAGRFPAPGSGRIDEDVRIQSVAVSQNVEIVETAAAPGDIAHTVDHAMTILLRGTDEIKTHTVQQGESFWTIASQNRMSFDELVAANPHIPNPERIQIGDQLNLVVPTPRITVVSEEIREYKKTIPFSTQYVYDESMWPWETRVQQPGRSGLAEVTERIVRENGYIVAQEIISERVLEAEQTQVVVRGSKQTPDSGTGQLIWPLNTGKISSRFGWRRGRLHGGVDIAAPKGTPVMAADSGIVKEAGVRGAFGQLVTIDHGGGKLVTLYAHLSSIHTKVGARVEKGEVIGLVGCTGRCTGSHLHFEVHENGRRVDPLLFYSR
ncbi:MAG TPA: M23 family metallopeptidase [Sphingobacteriaceae bacterium]|nr:M23 family metallopeptidase [Sphingobacteriaceae bacterium]